MSTQRKVLKNQVFKNFYSKLRRNYIITSNFILIVYKDDIEVTEEDVECLKIVRLMLIGKTDLFEERMANRLKTTLESRQRLDCLVWAGMFYSDEGDHEEALIYFDECMNSVIEIGPSRYQRKLLHRIYRQMKITFGKMERKDEYNKCYKMMFTCVEPVSM